jgi:UDP-glucuronate 4-epimerase
MTSKRILITGAAGFIGFHLALALKARGDSVVGLDNFNDYYDPSLKRERARLLGLENIEVIEGDVCDPSLLHRLLLEKEITHIVHLAAQAGVRYSLVNPQAYIKANIDGFLNILEVCRHFQGLPLIYASSSSVYGTNTKTPFSIDDRTDGQASLYGVTKKN